MFEQVRSVCATLCSEFFFCFSFPGEPGNSSLLPTYPVNIDSWSETTLFFKTSPQRTAKSVMCIINAEHIQSSLTLSLPSVNVSVTSFMHDASLSGKIFDMSTKVTLYTINNCKQQTYRQIVVLR